MTPPTNVGLVVPLLVCQDVTRLGVAVTPRATPPHEAHPDLQGYHMLTTMM